MISRSEEMRCYYPEQFSIKLSARESVIEIVDNHIYCSCWEEEGVAECEITEDYKYYEKLIVRNSSVMWCQRNQGALTRHAEWPVVVVVEVAADVSDNRCELPFSCKRECRRFDTAA